MYSSKEIRWFIPKRCEHIEKWFSAKNLNFTKINARTDFYLYLPDKTDLSIKLREGNIEFKLRRKKYELSSLASSAKGYFEDWVRWGFKVVQDDKLSNEIIQERKYNWIEVLKERMGVKVTHDSNKNLSIVGIDERVPYGCQIEYTRLIINNEEWFTFGTEWFGDSVLELESKFTDEIIGNTLLESKDSMGYNEFLNKITKHL